MVMQYMNVSGEVSPETVMTAESYISQGYQRILTFECNSGGFNWWEGDDPGNATLSAMAVMMLTDTKEVYETVDDAVIERTYQYLASVQKTDGSWSEDTHLHSNNANLSESSLRATCYTAWALAHGGFSDTQAVQSALAYISAHAQEIDDMYTAAMCLNALAAAGKKGAVADGLVAKLVAKALVEGETAHWAASQTTLVDSWGNSADVEATGLALYALIQVGQSFDLVAKGYRWLAEKKSGSGGWGSTQATVLALRAMVAAADKAISEPGGVGSVAVTVDGEPAGEIVIEEGTGDVYRTLELDHLAHPGPITVELVPQGDVEYIFQVVASWYLSWEDEEPESGPLTIEVSFDKTALAVNDIVEVTATVTNNMDSGTGMVIVDLPIPPGFSLMADKLVPLLESGDLSNYEKAGSQLILYVSDIPAGETKEYKYDLVALYPLKVSSGEASVYCYYDPDTRAEAEPVELDVE